MLSLLISATVSAESALIQPRIIGGSTANTNDWPWMAGIIYNAKNTYQVFCGASLIAQDWVLTAGHCVYDENPQDLAVVIDRPNLQSTQGETITIDEIIVHPQFNRDDLVYDIALLKLSRPSTVTPIETLPNFSDQDEAGKNALALGWGNTSTVKKTFPSDLQQVEIPIVSNAVCKKTLKGIIDTMLCAGEAGGGKDTCEGDSGGPLIVFDDGSKTWRQAGLTSFGEAPCAAPGFYGVYTRLDMFKDFISDTICSADSIPAAPSLTITTNGVKATATWNKVSRATGYRLNYAPYPLLYPIASIEQNQATRYSVDLPRGSAFYVAIHAYNGNCRSNYSNLEHFVIQ